jgi:site-specific DNA recombinase
VVWDKVKSVLSTPEVLLAEIGKQTEREKEELSTGNIEEEIRGLTRKVKGYDGQERRLMNALRLEVATPDIVLDELNQMKRERESDQKRLASLIQTKENLAKMIDMEGSIKELCGRLVPDLENCSNEDKKDAYMYLGLQVKATCEGADIKGFLDPNVLTTGQTWGCLHGLKHEKLFFSIEINVTK